MRSPDREKNKKTDLLTNRRKKRFSRSIPEYLCSPLLCIIGAFLKRLCIFSRILHVAKTFISPLMPDILRIKMQFSNLKHSFFSEQNLFFRIKIMKKCTTNLSLLTIFMHFVTKI